MTEIYGHKWTSSFGDSDDEGTWAAGLADLSMEQLKSGFIACVRRADPWPPSLPEFRTLCGGNGDTTLEADVEELAYNLIPSFDRKSLGRKEIEAIARRNIDRARTLLTGEAKPNGAEANTLQRLGYEPVTDMVAL